MSALLRRLTGRRAAVLAGVSTLLLIPPLAAQSLTGSWQTEGYGLALQATGDTLQVFEVTAVSCLPSWRAVRRPGAPNELTYQLVGGGGGGGVFFIRPGATENVRQVHHDGTASDQIIRRIAKLPSMCDRPTPDTPLSNFDVFAQTWKEHYILFDQKQVDWTAVVNRARSGVTSTTKPEALFDILQGMIAPFKDAHTFIQAPTLDRQFRALRAGTDRLLKGDPEQFRTKGMQEIMAVTEHRYLKSGLRKWCNGQVQYGKLSGSVGYLRILSESGYSRDGVFASGLQAFEATLDTIFNDPKLRGLVIDMRINFGGSDPYGLALASRLTKTEYVAYTKQARSDPNDRTQWTPGQPSVVRPSRRPSFHGKVVELIGPFTISAGETTTQALMGRIPHVVRIGENTQGVFSDVLVRRLPNGWSFGLPNEVFRDREGKTFDGPGIPPDIEVPVFADQDLAQGKDPAIARALEELAKSGAP